MAAGAALGGGEEMLPMPARSMRSNRMPGGYTTLIQARVTEYGSAFWRHAPCVCFSKVVGPPR